MKKKDELLIERIRSATTVVATTYNGVKAVLNDLEEAAARFLIEQYEDSTSAPAAVHPSSKHDENDPD